MSVEQILDAMMSIVTGSEEHKRIMRTNLRPYAEAVHKKELFLMNQKNNNS